MQQKYKMTGCARFFIFLLFFIPITYFGVHYFQGEDGLQKIKEYIGESNTVETKEVINDSGDSYDLQKTIDEKDKEIKKLESRIEILEDLLEQKNEEIKNLKN